MHENNRPQIMEILSDLENHFGVNLSKSLCKTFQNYCLANFASLEDLELAVELVAIHETNYGRFPPFNRFRELLLEHKRTQSGAYQPMDDNLLPPSPESRGVCPDDWNGYTNADVERLKAKVYVCQFFKSEATVAWGDRYRKEAIAEAQMRGISLALIGIQEKIHATP